MNTLWNSSQLTVVSRLPDLTSSITLLGYIKGGGQADIRKARLETKGGYRIVAVKQFRHTEGAMLLAEHEIRTWQKANKHNNIVELLGTIVDTSSVPSMISEFCERGDLLSHTFNAARLDHKNLLSDILEGIAYIHRLKFAHGDLKPENVVLTTQLQRLTAKICDFGSARDVPSKMRASLEYTCTALYQSPELNVEEDETPSPSFAADIWAFGCISFVVLCKKLPYHWVRNRWIIPSFIGSKRLPHAEQDQWAEGSLKDITLSCWMDVPARPSAADLLGRLKENRSETPTSKKLTLVQAWRVRWNEVTGWESLDYEGEDDAESESEPQQDEPKDAPACPAMPKEVNDRSRESPSSGAENDISDRGAPYTRLESVIYGGPAIVKSIRGSYAEYPRSAETVYLHYKSNMFGLKHPNLVEIFGVSPSPNNGLIMRRYGNNLLEHRSLLSHQERLKVLCEALQGLHALHTSEPPIVHQCLKSSNIMIGYDRSAKISLMNTEPYLAFHCGPSSTRSYSSNWPIVSRWWSSEVFEDKTNILTVENDIWAFGCVVLEVLTGSVPYPQLEEGESLVNFIRAGHLPDSGVLDIPELQLWTDVRSCWVTPRPTTEILLNIFCNHLAREIMREVPDLTGQVERAAQPFVRGDSADIYSGTYVTREGGSQKASVIVKHVRPDNTAQQVESLQWLERCARNRRYFDHENVCTLLGVTYSARLGPLLVLEHCAGGNLFEYMRANEEVLNMGNKLRIMSGILGALAYVRNEFSFGQVDLYPGNIVLDQNGSPKLCSLGPRQSLYNGKPSPKTQSDLETLRYFSPERLRLDFSSGDTWAFGCLVLMILSGRSPYYKIKTVYGVVQAITAGQLPYEETDCDSPLLWGMAVSCWNQAHPPRASNLVLQMDEIRGQLP